MNVKLFSAGFLPFCSGCRTSRLMIPNLAAALRQYLLMLKLKARWLLLPPAPKK